MSSRGLDPELDVGVNLFKKLELNRYLEVPDLPEPIRFDGYNCNIIMYMLLICWH